MRSLLIAGRTRLLAQLGRMSMYRLVLIALVALVVVAFAVSFSGRLSAQPVALVVSAAVLLAAVGVVDLIAHRLLRRPMRWESGAITALILLFVLFPTTEVTGLAALALAGAAASASKYVFAWRHRHIFNPAALGAAVVTVAGITGSMWWIGSPLLAAAVVIAGLAIAWRAEKMRVALTFAVVAIAVSFVRAMITAIQFDLPMTTADVASMVVFSSPVLFAAFFMITEPLTLPARRWQQVLVAAIGGFFVGWPLAIGSFVMVPEVAILVANLVAFVLVARKRRGARLTVVGRRALTPTVREVAFAETLDFTPGQYLELEVGHRRADTRGTRREFSVVSGQGEPLRVAYRLPAARTSSFKAALEGLDPGAVVSTTGVHGDFAAAEGPALFVAAGIGVTPFVSMLRSSDRDAVLVYVVSSVAELAYRDDIAATSARVIVVAPDALEVADLPAGWTAFASRINAETLPVLVPDLASRHALISGPPRLIAELAPALRAAKSVQTDAFAGY